MTHKITKIKNKKTKVEIIAPIIAIFSLILMVVICLGLVFLTTALKDKQDISMSDFETSQSTVIYDKNGNVISELGTTIRSNVNYEELPNALIDAVVSVEDSRFFEHDGIDIPRFLVAMLNNIRNNSFIQSGSTITMQLIKNTYYIDSNNELVESTIKDKLKEASNAIELETNTNKKQILSLYLNKLYYGGSRNIRGIKKASEYYFGKDVSELNLSECALLAGVIYNPDEYNPFSNIEKATNRRNTVLYQMLNHGYISQLEYDLAVNIKVEDLLKSSTSIIGDTIGLPYQAYIDVVIDEVYELTGYDPFITPMKIYTNIDMELQTLFDNIQAGNIDDIQFFDQDIEIGGAVVNNKTGAIVAIMGGRNYTSGNSLLNSHAADIYRNPGSVIQPILDYALALEELGWSTSHVLCDQPINYTGTNVVITNSSPVYVGDIKLEDALGKKLNTPAIQALQEVIQLYGNSTIVNYLKSLGFDVKLDSFDIKYGLGSSSFLVSPIQLANAYATIMNKGSYNNGSTIYRIEFLNGRAPINNTSISVDTLMSEDTAFQLATLLMNNVENDYSDALNLLADDYTVYAEIGESYWEDGNKEGVRNGTIKDSWAIASTSNYTCVIWSGYDKNNFIKVVDNEKNINSKALNIIMDKTVELYGNPSEIQKPETVTEITHIIGTFPYAEVIDGMPEEYITKGYIKVKDYQTIPGTAQSVEAMINDPEVIYNSETNKLSINWPEYPDATKLSIASDRKDISLDLGSKRIQASGNRIFDYSWIYGVIRYKADIFVNGLLANSVISDTNKVEIELNTDPGSSILVNVYYGYENYNINSSPAVVTLGVQDLDITFTIPSSINDLNELSKYGILVTYETIRTTDSTKIESYVITDNQGRTMDDDGVMYSFNSVHTMSQTDIQNLELKCTHYIAPAASLSISSTEIDENGHITITAIVSNSDEKQIDWILPNGINVISEELLTNGESITIEIKESITISARIHGTNILKEFYISLN